MYLPGSGSGGGGKGARRRLRPEGSEAPGDSKRRAEPEAAPSPAERFPADSPIFVAESDPKGKGALNRILSEFQLGNVTFTDDFYKALHKGRFEPYALLLVSQTIDKGDSLKLLANLRRQGKNTKSPIVFLHNPGDSAAKAQAEGAGADGVIEKPLEEEPLRALLEKVLGKHILTRKAQTAQEQGYSSATSEAVERGKRLLARGDLQGAGEAFENALVTGAGSAEVYCGLAEVYLSRGEKESAEQVIAEAARINPQIRDKFRLREPAFLARARGDLKSQDYAQAKNEFEAAIFAEPKSAEAHVGLGEALAALGDAEGARAAFESALALGERPSDLHVYNRMGIAARRNKDYGQALRAYDKAIAFDPEDPILYYNKAIVLVALKKFREARVLLEKSLSLKADFLYAQNALRNIQAALKAPRP
ncbi:MAG: tetratricopeptide repeat protein [Nitrospinota bacterium]